MSTLSQPLLHKLLEDVINGTLAPASKISEPELARRYQVGRGSIREAVFRLEGLGLAERMPRSGARIIPLSPQHASEIYTVREALEGTAARLAARHHQAHERVELHRLLDDHERHLLQHDNSGYVRQCGNDDFHYRIIKASHNSKLITMLCHELYHLLRMYRHRSKHRTEDPKQALAEHRQIAQAICQRDEELAELLMRRHIQRAAQIIDQALNSAPQSNKENVA